MDWHAASLEAMRLADLEADPGVKPMMRNAAMLCALMAVRTSQVDGLLDVDAAIHAHKLARENEQPEAAENLAALIRHYVEENVR